MNLRDVIIVVAFAGIVAFLGVQIWNIYAEESSPDFEYLECVPLDDFGSGVTAVTGCAEIVDVGEGRYVRMTDVGEFTVYKGATAKTYEVGPAALDLFLQTGQSNSVYYSNGKWWPDHTKYTEDPESGPSPIGPGIGFYVGVDDGSTHFAGFAQPSNYARSKITDMVSEDGKVRVASDYPVFIYDWHQMTGNRVLIANSGIASLSINEFAEGGQLYNRTMEVMELTRSLLDGTHYNVTVRGVLWSQGEADHDMDPAEYSSKLIALMDEFEKGTFGGFAFDYLTTTLPRYPGAQGLIGSAEGQVNAAAHDKRITVATSIATGLHAGLPYFNDAQHYTQTVHNWIGEAFARTLAAFYGYSAIPETLVICEITGEALPPAECLAVGTSGKPYQVTVNWYASEVDGPGTYDLTGDIIKVPNGTAIFGLKGTAHITLGVD